MERKSNKKMSERKDEAAGWLMNERWRMDEKKLLVLVEP